MNLEYVDEWKENELKRTMEMYKQFIDEYYNYAEIDSYHTDRWNNSRWIAVRELGLENKPESEWTEEEFEKVNAKKKEIQAESDKAYKQFSNFKAANSYYYRVFDRTMYRRCKFNNEEDKALKEAEKMFIIDIDRHFDTLQAKVEKRIGKIEMINHIGGDDYEFKGENGTCKVEVILAGGYNIQRLHTRWIVKK